MNLIDISRIPCILCPRKREIISLSECTNCQYFYGFNSQETKIGCEFERVDIQEVDGND